MKPRPSGIDTRLRPPDERRKITPPSPQRRLLREPAIPRKDNSEAVRKYSDAIRKYRKESSIQTPEPVKKCKHASDAGSVQKLLEPGSKGDFGEKKNVIEGSSVVLSKDAVFGCGDVLNKSHESEDFDCPCCDRTSTMMDEAGLSDIEVKMFTSCDVIAPDEPFVLEDIHKDACNNGVSNNYYSSVLITVIERLRY